MAVSLMVIFIPLVLRIRKTSPETTNPIIYGYILRYIPIKLKNHRFKSDKSINQNFQIPTDLTQLNLFE